MSDSSAEDTEALFIVPGILRAIPPVMLPLAVGNLAICLIAASRPSAGAPELIPDIKLEEVLGLCMQAPPACRWVLAGN
jgi:hypothetical protein